MQARCAAGSTPTYRPHSRALLTERGICFLTTFRRMPGGERRGASSNRRVAIREVSSEACLQVAFQIDHGAPRRFADGMLRDIRKQNALGRRGGTSRWAAVPRTGAGTDVDLRVEARARGAACAANTDRLADGVTDEGLAAEGPARRAPLLPGRAGQARREVSRRGARRLPASERRAVDVTAALRKSERSAPDRVFFFLQDLGACRRRTNAEDPCRSEGS